MKAYIHENELFPYYGVSLKPGYHESVADVPEETIRKWRKISALFHKSQTEIAGAVRAYEEKQAEIKHLRQCFTNPAPSRQDKAYILRKFSWEQIDTSLWEKDGRQVRLHEAYNECKREFDEQYPTGEVAV
ncbi:hypothetical protein [Nitrospira sp. BLG_2]|uniref:hypothetical protein n=1 Tax=Nitrospira sp. BLG_2 TaxID=3397507 RepID=UPI003B9B6345